MRAGSTVLAPVGAAIVTGGSSGIGKTFIELLFKGRPGVRVCNLSRRSPALCAARAAWRHVPCDLGLATDRARAVEAVDLWLRQEAPDGPVWLVNNAGLGAYGDFAAGGASREARLVEVNLAAMVDLTARLLPHLLERGGAILNVASVAAFQPTPGLATYGATKAFVLQWSLALREELRPRGIPVSVLCPGPTRTEFFTTAGLADARPVLARAADPTAVAWAGLRALERGRAITVVPGRFRPLASLVGWLPRTWSARISAAVLRRWRPGKASP